MRLLVRGATQHLYSPCHLRIGGVHNSRRLLSNTSSAPQIGSPSTSKSASIPLAGVPTRATEIKSSSNSSTDAAAKNGSPQNPGHEGSRKPSKERRGRPSTTKPSSESESNTQSKNSVPQDIAHLIDAAATLQVRLHDGLELLQASDTRKVSKISLEEVLKAAALEDSSPDETYLVDNLRKSWAGKAFLSVSGDLDRAITKKALRDGTIADSDTRKTLQKLGILRLEDLSVSSNVSPSITTEKEQQSSASSGSRPRPNQTMLESLAAAGVPRIGEKTPSKGNTTGDKKSKSANQFPKELAARELQLLPLGLGEDVHIPSLSFDLSRVLFNPGVYQLRDPRSRVYNFDPYLEQPMSVTEFNFDALNPYVTSSKDSTLIQMARTHKKRYIGSSSSMSNALSQFHFLLSHWRPLNLSTISRSFKESRLDYTVITRAPASIFLRYRNGVYAIDADKEFEEPNLLMGLGKSLEKLLTLEKADFEKWRKTDTAADKEFSDVSPEAFHYSEQGKFLLRSQLDARDPRLPGSGVFDLKTRAVAGVRMNLRDHEVGSGYQIKERYGLWESYEREFYDMARSAFLKYSLQVRMGNMDGVLVAYHNIQRLFGFQYIPLSEMDLILHGSAEPTIGDQEFRLSIQFLEQMFDRATSQFPKQSIRFHFETREPTITERTPHMHIFVEPWSDSDIDTLSAETDQRMSDYERKLFNGEQPDYASSDSVMADPETQSNAQSQTAASKALGGSSRHSDDSDADPAAIDKILAHISPDAVPASPRPLAVFKLVVQNKVNKMSVNRPENISPSADWTVGYQLSKVDESSGRRLYNFCKNRRMAAMKTSLDRNTFFYRNLRELSEKGASWRQRQDALDAQQEKVALYPEKHVE